MDKKACSKCGQEFLLTEEFWHRLKTSTDGFDTQCKICVNERHTNYRKKNPEKFKKKAKKRPAPIPKDNKTCSKCDQEFPLTEKFWQRNKKTKDGFSTRCKKCLNEQQAIYIKANAERLKERPTPPTDKKACTKCEREFPLTGDFWHKNKNTKDGFAARCKECRKKQSAIQYKENVETIKEQHANYRKKNKDRPAPNPNDKKTCTKCGRSIFLTEKFWHKNKTTKDGFVSQCKSCTKKRKAIKYKEKHKKERALKKLQEREAKREAKELKKLQAIRRTKEYQANYRKKLTEQKKDRQARRLSDQRAKASILELLFKK